ncbi:hypothetical protein NM688_g5003 [Phlebia brevispora]|uniref:Uncharacterized protein n=1 Tax=Phlebia brevispora TaxID=194682 RepID=A0ACC1T1C4_9APHY|nr:hypothetical protein NM688_g5003 [Phlebia brevispora]
MSSPLQTYHHSSLHRRPSKKSSFLSLRRETRATDAFDSFPSVEDPFEAAYSVSGNPFAHRTYAADTSSHQSASQGHSTRSHRSKSGSKSISSVKDVHGHRRAKGSHGQPRSPGTDRQTFDFPCSAEEQIPWPSETGEDPYARTRITSGPSSSHDRKQRAYSSRTLDYAFRDSGSSSLSHFETPPQTPLDEYSFRERPYPVPVVVAAPIAGVETMDALVDGMNGFTEDEQFLHLTGLSSRSQYKKTGFHPLYHPPLPTPPPGIKLGGALPRDSHKAGDSDTDDDATRILSSRHSQHSHHRKHPVHSSRTTSSSILTRQSLETSTTSIALRSQQSTSFNDENAPSTFYDDKITCKASDPPTHREIIPSISDIIKAYAPPSQQMRTKPSLSRRSSYATTYEGSIQHDIRPDPTTIEEESDIISRSSVDTIAEEVQQTIRNQTISNVTSGLQQAVPFPVLSRPQSVMTDLTRSPISDGRRNSSVYNCSTVSDQPPLPPMDLSSLTKAPIHSPSQAIAQYLRSSRLTTVMRLTRSPHASRECPLSVSFADLGSPTGFPLVVFLGLGCVRHIMGLYDEMAECLGIRLITIDRWGLGRTDSPRSKLLKGIPEWASVVEEVLDRLKLDQCSVMAHSAGAPYALAFANRFPERIRGDVCLLAPWVGGGEGAGYKWLKYVPNGILKTAQAAEWKVQAWMLGKPPTISYEGIGFDVQSAISASNASTWPLGPTSTFTEASLAKEAKPRPSGDSSAFSDYDDLRDFEGKFESASSAGRNSLGERRNRTMSESKHTLKPRKPSKGFLGRLRGAHSSGHAPSEESSSTASAPLESSKRAASTTHPSELDVGLGLDGVDWDATIRAKRPGKSKSIMSTNTSSHNSSYEARSSRTSGRRSVSFGASTAKPSTREPIPPVPTVPPLSPTSPPEGSISYQAALGNALISASHAESSKGTHGDLLQILNHDRLPWGFSYGAYPHKVRIWYGDHDEKIAENAVRWMESTMGQDKCQIKVVKGADHALMFKSSVVVEVLEYFAECWRSD